MKRLKPYHLKGLVIKMTEDELESVRNFERTFKEFCKKWKFEYSVETLIWYLDNVHYFVKEDLE